MPAGLDRIFFTNSGSESVDTALKIALAYHRARGEGQRTRLIGRERGYHGVGFGGISVGGIAATARRSSARMMPGVDHLPHTHNLEHNAFSRASPQWGAHLADELERIVTLHDASTIAAVIVEPVAGSTGVLVPPQGYLKKLREICTKHGILLIFDEVITGFGRLGKATAREYFGVTPDIMTHGKGHQQRRDADGRRVPQPHDLRHRSCSGPRECDRAVPRLHLFGAPARLRCGAATSTSTPRRPVRRAPRSLAPQFETGRACAARPAACERHSQSRPGRRHRARTARRAAGRARYEAFVKCFERGVLVRSTGDILAFSPPLIVEDKQIEHIFDVLGQAIRETA